MNSKDKIGKIERALARLECHKTECSLCPRECKVNRLNDEKGICQSGNQALVSHALLHFGEEPVLSGYQDASQTKLAKSSLSSPGSGAIFFSGCNLKCLFCQNYQLSWLLKGRPVSDEKLAEMMLDLQDKGALNINLVSPTHLTLPILHALKIAYGQGLHLPLVYNSNGYEKAEVIESFEGIVDIYLPDLKYYSPEVSKKFSGASDYFQQASRAIREMYSQQPELVLSDEEIAQKGLIIRHLVLPGQVEDSLAILEWVQKNLSTSVCLSLMSQYHPCFRAPEEIQRALTPREYKQIIERALELGFENLFIQPEPFKADEHLIPDFNLKDPFRWK
jgi:putative pyruvate formate lyase activating enzyme